MFKQTFLGVALATAATSPLIAQQADSLGVRVPPIVQTLVRQLPQTLIVDHTFVFMATPESTAPAPAVLAEISTWLSENFDLPASDQLPTVVFAASAQIAALHYRGFLDRQQQAAAAHDQTATGASEIVAVYDHETQTIYLPNGWQGATPSETSVLVHEMVHHLQHGAQLKHACPQERERLAYRAQARWLERFGRSLGSEFELDGFTLLVRTSCGP
jgi:hypothetical protein